LVTVEDIEVGTYYINYVQASSGDYDFGSYRPEYGHALYKINGQCIYTEGQLQSVLDSLGEDSVLQAVFIDNYSEEHNIEISKKDFLASLSFVNQSYT